MSLITCPECNHNVSDKAIACPNCGYPLAPAPRTGVYQRKRPKLPNGYGAIKRLSGRRENPYAAYPPTTDYNDNGSPVAVPAVGYYKTWHAAYTALVEWHRIHDTPAQAPILSTRYKSTLTFAQVYDLYYSDKYKDSPGRKKLSVSSMVSTRAAYKNCAVLHDRIFCSLVTKDLQGIVDNCPLKHASLELIVSLFKQLYAYAIQNDLAEKDYAQYVKINIPDDDEGGVPFTAEELDLLWGHTDSPDVCIILIMIYSGFRVSAYQTLEVNKAERYFKGGVKTAASKNRIVPIHPAIYPFVDLLSKLPVQSNYRNKRFYPALESLGILYAPTGERHTPHDCRHTFSWLCDTYGVDDISKHLLMGHAIQGDVEGRKYSHRTLEQLHAEIEKIIV